MEAIASTNYVFVSFFCLFCYHWLLPLVVVAGMGQYSKGVVEKFPSGAALSSLTESDMEKKLAISNPLHRKKLALALQEKKTPQR